MKKQFIGAAAGIAMLFAIAILWWRVQSLEQTVSALNQRISSNPSVVTAGQRRIDVKSEQPKVFKLIDSTHRDEPASSVGVPWDVERAMMGGAREGELRRKLTAPPEVTPVPQMELPTKPNLPTKLDRKSDSN